MDELTMISNRRGFEALAQHALNVCRRMDKPASLLFFDLNGFKAINDTYGHLAGDHVLSVLAKVVAPMIRSEDVFARYGGEEFVILSRSTDPPSAAVVAERVRASLEQYKFEFEGSHIAVTVSVGVASTPHTEIRAPEDLVARADKAMYEAKRSGRGCAIVFNDAMQARLARQVQIESGLRKALLEYCRQDTLGLIRLLEKMRAMEAADAKG